MESTHKKTNLLEFSLTDHEDMFLLLVRGHLFFPSRSSLSSHDDQNSNLNQNFVYEKMYQAESVGTRGPA